MHQADQSDTAFTPDHTRPDDERGISDVVQGYNRPVLFYVLATAWPWAFWFAAAYLSNLDNQTDLVRTGTAAFGLAGLIAPVLVVAWLVRNRPELRADIAARLRWPRQVPWSILAATFLLLLASIELATAISVLFGASPEQFQFRGGWTFTAGVLPVWVTLIGAAILEELAWHGYGTDTLVRRMRVFSASMLFTVIWALWHLPLGFIKGYYHQEVVEQGVLQVLNFPLSMVAFVLLMNWLYFRGGRSILIPIVFHLTANLVNEIFLTDPDTKIIQTGLLLVVAAVVVWRDRELFFTRPQHRDLSGA